MSTRIPPLEKAIELAHQECERIESMPGDTVTCAAPKELATVLDANYDQMIKDLEHGSSVSDVFAKQGIDIDPNAAFGFGCTDNCDCTKADALDEVRFIEERLSALQRRVQ